MASIAQGPYRDYVKENDGLVVSILRGATKGHLSDNARRSKSNSNYGHERGKEFNFHIASVVQHRYGRYYHRDHTINRVKTRHNMAMSRVGIKVCGVEGVLAGR